MIVSFKIDGVEYNDRIVTEKPFTISYQVESGLNNPTSSSLKVTLLNSEQLTNIFQTNDPYGLYNLGYVEVGYWEFVFFNVFRGYIDKTAVPFDITSNLVDITVMGLEKSIGATLSGYDITQAFFQVSPGIQVRQRGGRTGHTRLSTTDYNLISDVLAVMFGDIGYNSSNHLISYDNSDKFIYKYDPDIYGALHIFQPRISLRDNLGSRGRVSDLSSINNINNFANRDKQSESYNSLIKNWAGLTGSVFFYNHRTGKINFVKRDYNYGDAVDISNLILDQNYLISYRDAYRGIVLQFEDVKVALKFGQSIIPGDNLIVGIEYKTGEAAVQRHAGYFYLVYNVFPPKYYILGNPRPTETMQLTNGIELIFREPLKDYLRPTPSAFSGGTEINEFAKTWIYKAYEKIFNSYRIPEITLQGVWIPPFRIVFDGQEHTIFNADVDLLNETTKISFEY